MSNYRRIQANQSGSYRTGHQVTSTSSGARNQFGMTTRETEQVVETIQERTQDQIDQDHSRNLANHLLTSNVVSGQVTNTLGSGRQVTTQGGASQYKMTSQTRSATTTNKGPVTKDGKLVIYEEVPVFVEKIVEVPFENIIERPVEKRIENRYYVDKEVEVIKEVVKEVPKIIEIKKEKIIEIEKFVDEEEIKENHIDVVEEVVKIVEVPEIEYKDEITYKNVEILKVQPRRTKIEENIIYKDRVNIVDKVVKKDRVIENDVFIEKSTGQRVHNYNPNAQIKIIEEIEEEPYNVYVDKIIEVKREVPYDVVKEEENIIVERVPVEKVVVQTEYYDDVKVVEVPVENVIEVPVEKQVLVDKYVDKEVIVEVEKKVPVPKHVEKIITKVIDVPVIREVHVDVPYANVVENHMATDVEVTLAEPKVTHVNREYAKIEEVEETEDLEIEFEVDRIVENEVHTHTEVPVEVTKQVVNPRYKQTFYDKQVDLRRVKEKPNVRASYRDVPVAVNVKQNVTIEQPVIQENLKVVTKDKPIDVVHTTEVVQYDEVKQHMELKNEQKTSKMTSRQKGHLESVTNETSRVQLDNLKLRTDIQAYEEHITQIRGIIIDDESLEKNKAEFRQKIANLDKFISECTTESRKIEQELRSAHFGADDFENVDVYTEQEILRLEEQIKEVEERNQQLRNLLGKVDIRASKVGEMSSVNVKESMRVTREVEQKLSSYERDPNARITQGQKMSSSVYVDRPQTGSRTVSSQQYQGTQRVGGGAQVRTTGGGAQVRRSGGYTSSSRQTGGTTYVSGGTRTGTVTQGTTGYTRTGGNVTSNTTTTQSRTYQSSNSGGGYQTTTVTESYTNSRNPGQNYSNTQTSVQPYSMITNNQIRQSKVIKESAGEYVPSKSLLANESNRPKLFNTSGNMQYNSGKSFEESKVIVTKKNVTRYN